MGWRLRRSDKTVRKFAEVPIYCQWQKCSPGNVVSGSIRFMRIFAGVRWREGVKWEWGRRKWWLFVFFARYIFRRITPKAIIITLYYRPLVAPHWHRNSWPSMTLNDYFALKSVPRSTSLNGLAFWLSDKTVLEFADLSIHCQRQKCSAQEL